MKKNIGKGIFEKILNIFSRKNKMKYITAGIQIEDKQDLNEDFRKSQAEAIQENENKEVSKHLKQAVKECLEIIEKDKIENKYHNPILEEEQEKFWEDKVSLRRQLFTNIIREALIQDMKEEIEQGLTEDKGILSQVKIAHNADYIARRVTNEGIILQELLEEIEEGRYAPNYVSKNKKIELEQARQAGKIVAKEKIEKEIKEEEHKRELERKEKEEEK